MLAFGCAVMIVAMGDISDTPTCQDLADATFAAGECFNGSSLQKAVTLGLGWTSGVMAGVAALIALIFVVTGRYSRLTLQLAALAVLLGGVSILTGSV
jgi:hypothetical protein